MYASETSWTKIPRARTTILFISTRPGAGGMRLERRPPGRYRALCLRGGPAEHQSAVDGPSPCPSGAALRPADHARAIRQLADAGALPGPVLGLVGRSPQSHFSPADRGPLA